jgi:hypothetical protein
MIRSTTPKFRMAMAAIVPPIRSFYNRSANSVGSFCGDDEKSVEDDR